MNLENALYFKNKNDWRKWLEVNHNKTNEVWLVHYKKSASEKGLNHIDGVEEALCFGWIDSKLKKVDEDKFILKYSPRKPKSVWSKINKDKTEKLIASGKMTQAGLDKIEDAKRHGLWDTAYTNLVKDKLPSDLKQALMKNNIAWKNFQKFANSYRNMYVGWINNAKAEETRKRRIDEIVSRSEQNKKPGME